MGLGVARRWAWQQVQVGGGGLDARMTQQNLHTANVGASFEHVGGKAVPQHMRVDALTDAGLARDPKKDAVDGFAGKAWICRSRPAGE
jgi:hypothetical protein